MNRVVHYRPDIDGLRAVAVLAVIFYHFKIEVFSGGFVGVDIFFVISGYLIIGAVIRELSSGSFSLLDFWERRIRRIIPAAVVVMLSVAALSYYFLIIPTEYAAFGSTLMAQSVFLSNWLFMGMNDYFAPSAETMPLLHTWTLALEEQFYLIFPLVVVLCYPLARERFGKLMLSFVLLSFSYGIWLTFAVPNENFGIGFLPEVWGSAKNSSAAFYFLLPRLWEFIIGGMVAVYALKVRKRIMAEVLSLAGVIVILAGTTLITDATAFPGIAVLLPVLGTVAIIVSNTDHKTLTNSILSIPPLVWTGLVSYSLYLWHWPLLVLFQFQSLPGETLTPLDKSGLLVIMLVLAFVTYKYIETPVRQKRVLKDRRYLYGAAAASLGLVFFVGLFINLNQGFPDRVSLKAKNIDIAMRDVSPRQKECFTGRYINSSEELPCLLGLRDAESVDFVLWGDSHADAVMPAFDEYGKTVGRTGIFFGVWGCVPLIDQEPFVNREPCLHSREAAMEYILEHKPKDVFLVSEWTGVNLLEAQDMAPNLTTLIVGTVSELPEDTHVTILYRIPSLPEYSFREWFFQVEKHSYDPLISIPRTSGIEVSVDAFNVRIADAAARLANISMLDPLDRLCEGSLCYLGDQGGMYYRDNTHLSVYGAERLILPLLLKGY